MQTMSGKHPATPSTYSVGDSNTVIYEVLTQQQQQRQIMVNSRTRRSLNDIINDWPGAECCHKIVKFCLDWYPNDYYYVL